MDRIETVKNHFEKEADELKESLLLAVKPSMEKQTLRFM